MMDNRQECTAAPEAAAECVDTGTDFPVLRLTDRTRLFVKVSAAAATGAEGILR